MMSIRQLLEKLETRRKSIDLVITAIRQELEVKTNNRKAKEIIQSLPKRTYTKRRKLHWSQTPEGKKKMSAIMKAKYAAGWKPKRK